MKNRILYVYMEDADLIKGRGDTYNIRSLKCIDLIVSLRESGNVTIYRSEMKTDSINSNVRAKILHSDYLIPIDKIKVSLNNTNKAKIKEIKTLPKEKIMISLTDLKPDSLLLIIENNGSLFNLPLISTDSTLKIGHSRVNICNKTIKMDRNNHFFSSHFYHLRKLETICNE